MNWYAALLNEYEMNLGNYHYLRIPIHNSVTQVNTEEESWTVISESPKNHLTFSCRLLRESQRSCAA